MAFLDNSGDIILDAVLTDTGRFRLAKGDGTFKISKFAFGDEEINYGSYNTKHASGSAYYDLDILQTPILEAFTNNTSTMKTKLISIPRTNLLYLPILKINNLQVGAEQVTGGTTDNGSGSHFVSVDQSTSNNFSALAGVIAGQNPGGNNSSYVRIDQGLDTTEIPKTFVIDPDLKESQYIVQMDNRLGSLVSPNGTAKNPSFIDDDNVAHYYVSLGTDSEFVKNIDFNSNADNDASENMVISGPRGTHFDFSIASSVELQSSTFLFTKLGSTFPLVKADGTSTVAAVKFIDTIVKITGATTGYSLDVPVRYIKTP